MEEEGRELVEDGVGFRDLGGADFVGVGHLIMFSRPSCPKESPCQNLLCWCGNSQCNAETYFVSVPNVPRLRLFSVLKKAVITGKIHPGFNFNSVFTEWTRTYSSYLIFLKKKKINKVYTG